MTASATVDSGHGRLEQRRLTASTALLGARDWPWLAQMVYPERHVTLQKSGAQRQEVIYGVTSLGPDRAGPERVLGLVRQHWSIEHKSHWVHDITFDED